MRVGCGRGFKSIYPVHFFMIWNYCIVLSFYSIVVTQTFLIPLCLLSVSAINVTAVNQLTAQAITHTEQAYIAMQNNDTQAVFRNLNLALNELESVRGNLTLTALDGGSSSMQ